MNPNQAQQQQDEARGGKRGKCKLVVTAFFICMVVGCVVYLYPSTGTLSNKVEVPLKKTVPPKVKNTPPYFQPPLRSGGLLEEDNATVYIEDIEWFSRTIYNPRISESEYVQKISDWLAKFLKPSQSIIIDCPDDQHINGSYSNSILKAVLSFNRASSSPVHVWLHHRVIILEEDMDNSSCVNLAVQTNNMFPGTIKGILGLSDELVIKTILFSWVYSPFQWYLVWEPYSQKYFDKLDEQGLKFGLYLKPSHCNQTAEQVPDSIIAKFDKIFYLEREFLQQRQQLVDAKNGSTWTVVNDYNECKDIFKEKFANVTVTYVASIELRRNYF